VLLFQNITVWVTHKEKNLFLTVTEAGKSSIECGKSLLTALANGGKEDEEEAGQDGELETSTILTP
jgi:hypothetical protein